MENSNKRIKEIEEGKEYLAKKPHSMILDSHKEQIMKWLKENLSRVRIHEKIKQLSYSCLNCYEVIYDQQVETFILVPEKLIWLSV